MGKCLVLDASFVQTDMPGEKSPCGREDVGKWIDVMEFVELDCSIMISLPNVLAHLPGCTQRQELVKRLETIRTPGVFYKLVRAGKIRISKKQYGDADARYYGIPLELDVKPRDLNYILHAIRIAQKHCNKTIIVTCDSAFFREDVRYILKARGIEVLKPSELLK